MNDVSDEKKPEDTTSTEPEGEEQAADTANPEAIAKRVAALGGDDNELDRIASEEERKLAERRAAKKKKKSGLEVAASKKLAKIGTRAEPKRNVAVAADADPLIEKTAKLRNWAKQNQSTVQRVGALVAVALLGVAGYLYYGHKKEAEASLLLSKAVADEQALVGEPPKDGDEDEGMLTYKTFDARRDAALQKYRDVESKFPKTGAAILARLAEGSILLDKNDPEGAANAFTDVRGTALASADQEVKGRAIEGLGFAYELKAAKSPGDAAKNLDEALKLYKELENTVDVRGWKELAMYHQARVLEAKGDKEEAKKMLLSIKERLSKPEEPSNSKVPHGEPFPFLTEVAMDRLRALDPAAAPKRGQMGTSPQLTPAQIQKMMDEARKKGGGAGGHGGHP